MIPEAPINTAAVQFDQILTSAVVLNWDALTPASMPGRIKIEYHIGTDCCVEYLKLWVSARDYWSLICDYAPHLGWSDGPRFANGYHSRPLARLLQSIMLNQSLFKHGFGPNTKGTLEVATPTVEDKTFATLQVCEVFPPAAKRGGSA